MKTKNRKLCRYINNKGGTAFVYKLLNYRLILYNKEEGVFKLIKIKFNSEEQVTRYARRYLNDARIARILNRVCLHYGRELSDVPDYPVYMYDYHKYTKIYAHDDLKLSYWYKAGSYRAMRDTAKYKPSSFL